MNQKSSSDAAGSVLSRWRETIIDRLSKPPFSAPTKPTLNGRKPRTTLTWEELQELDERQFLQLVVGFFAAVGFRCTAQGSAPVLSANLYLCHGDEERPFGLVQAKRQAAEIGTDLVQQLHATLTRESLTEGYIIATGSFTPEARAYDTGRKVMLLDGREFVVRINRLLPQNRAPILAAVLKTTEAAQIAKPQ